jgi:hypothetical protein
MFGSCPYSAHTSRELLISDDLFAVHRGMIQTNLHKDHIAEDEERKRNSGYHHLNHLHKHENVAPVSQFMHTLESDLSHSSYPWRHLRNEIALGKTFGTSVHAAREEISLLLNQYLKHFHSQDAVIHEMISICLNRRPSVSLL